jgi:hypothetical protein
MNVKSSGKNVFSELEIQNPDVARAFRIFRRRSEPPGVYFEPAFPTWGVPGNEQMPSSEIYEEREYSRIVSRPALRMRRASHASPIFPFILLLIGVTIGAITVGPALVRLLITHWQAILIPLGGVCAGAGAVLLVSRIGASPLRAVAPPKANTEDPLQELKDLAERTASRLQTAYRLQLWAVLVVGVIFIILIIWSVVMVSQNRILYASAFGSGSVAMVILTQWKWQPFDRINQARRLADNADTLATGLRLRMKTISEITNPSKRAKAQWDAVEEYLKHT